MNDDPDSSASQVRPDYHGGSIVNLMASIARARGGPPTGHAMLRALDTEVLVTARNLVLLVIDGLGYRHLAQSTVAPVLQQHLASRLTSVFPSTTAAAIPVFFTALAPRQHGLTGWHMMFREIGAVAAPLPFHFRAGSRPLRQAGVTPEELLRLVPLFDGLADSTCVIAPERIVHSDFNVAASGRARRVGYRTLDDLRNRILEVAGMEGRRLVYAYYPELDSIAHGHGIGSAEARAELARIDAMVGELLQAGGDGGTMLVVTADHGFVDTTEATRIALEDHPELASMLALPLCGEPRVAHCYVDPDRCSEFERHVRGYLAQRFDLHRSRDLIAEGWYGPGATHPELASRVGHYTLVARDNWAITDRVLGEKRHVLVGVHGGVSTDEMYVPLIVARF